MTGVQPFIAVAAALFCVGILGVISRRNVFTVFMSVQLMLNAANIMFIAFSLLHGSMNGHALVLIVIAIAAAQAALALAAVILLHRARGSLDIDLFRVLSGSKKRGGGP